MSEIVIIGAGCAGLTAAIYAARAGKSVLVLEGEGVGGQIATSPRVENYPGIMQTTGMEFADALCEQATGFGAQLELADAERVEKRSGGFAVVTKRREYPAAAVIIAVGARPRELGIAGERELAGNGISYCALCDGAFYKGENVAVVGGGNAALQSAEYLSSICNRVTLVHRRAEFRGERALAERVAQLPNVELKLGCTVAELNGTGELCGVALCDSNGVSEKIALSGLFVAVGRRPQNERFADTVKLDEAGYIAADESCFTSCPGVFVAGDCRTKTVRQLTTAAADGAVAATAACEWLSRNK